MAVQSATLPGLRRTALTALAVVILAALPARASDPIAVYALVDKVVLEPSENAPERIQVWGVFAVARDNNPNDYNAARRGYLYLALKPGKEELCRKEWADLKRVAGTGDAVGFGVRWDPKPRIRAAADKPEGPDPYSVNIGMVKLGNRNSGVTADLKAVASSASR
jgi:hypothetical protein